MSKGHFEAKKHAYRQTQDGVVVSFVIHPNDVPADLATAPLGTIYMIGFAVMGDASTREDEDEVGGTSQRPDAGQVRTSPAKPKRKFDELPPSQQAALRCNDPQFKEFVRERLGQHQLPDEDTCADFIRSGCAVKSRSELDYMAKLCWGRLDNEFRNWLGTKRAIAQHDAYAR